MAERSTFPQSGDNDPAENFAQLIGHPDLTDYVATGMNFDVDYSIPEVTITTGLAYILRDQDTVTSVDNDDGETRLNTGFAVQLPQDTLSLSDNTNNYIYIQPNLDNTDNGQFVAVQNTSNAPSEGLRIGTINTSSDNATQENRLRDLVLGSVWLKDYSRLWFGDNKDMEMYWDGDDETLVTSNKGNLARVMHPNSIRFYEDIWMGNTSIVLRDSSGTVMHNFADGTNTLYHSNSDDLRFYSRSLNNITYHVNDTDGHTFDLDVKLRSGHTLTVNDISANSGDINLNTNLRFNNNSIADVNSVSGGGDPVDFIDPISLHLIRYRDSNFPAGDRYEIRGAGGGSVSNTERFDFLYYDSDSNITGQTTNRIMTIYKGGAKPANFLLRLNDADLDLQNGYLYDSSGNISIDSHVQFISAGLDVKDENGVTMWEPSGANNTFYVNNSKSLRFYDNANNTLLLRAQAGGPVNIGTDTYIGDNDTLHVDNIDSAGGSTQVSIQDRLVVAAGQSFAVDDITTSGSSSIRIGDIIDNSDSDGFILPHKISRPSSPTRGQVIYRTDKD